MDNFYDINDFIVFVIKKWKTFILVVILASLIFAGNRGLSMYNDYISQPEQADNSAAVASSDEEPMWTCVQNIIHITEDVSDQTRISEIIEAYSRLCGNEELLNSMTSQWFESEKNEYAERTVRFHDYGYILDKEVNYPYAERDFYTQFLLNSTDILTAGKNRDSYANSFVLVGFKSTDPEIAEKIADSYSTELTELVEKTLGDFSYEITGKSIWKDLPTASSGTQYSRVTSSVTSTSVTMKQVIMQTVKGLVWGAVIGVVLAFVLIFFMYMMTRKIYLLSDIKKYQVSILGAGFAKKSGFNKIRAWFHRIMEGGIWDYNGQTSIVRRISEMPENISNNQIAVTGTCSQKLVSRFVEELNKAAGSEQFVFIDGINFSMSGIKKIQENNYPVILVERMGESLKDNLELEISTLNKQNAAVLGVVVFE